MLPEIKRFAGRLLHPHHGGTVVTGPTSAPTVLGESVYHCGDHWQNLLASPMDARHYVLEDWGDAAASDNVEIQDNDAYARVGIRAMRRRQA